MVRLFASGALVLHAGQPAVQTMGVADVLFGANGAGPAGRTVQTWYDASYADGLAIFDMNLRPGSSAFPRSDCTEKEWSKCEKGTNPGRTHR